MQTCGSAAPVPPRNSQSQAIFHSVFAWKKEYQHTVFQVRLRAPELATSLLCELKQCTCNEQRDGTATTLDVCKGTVRRGDLRQPKRYMNRDNSAYKANLRDAMTRHLSLFPDDTPWPRRLCRRDCPSEKRPCRGERELDPSNHRRSNVNTRREATIV